MFPTWSEWKSWKTSEKAAYAAQLLASLALLPTVIFAWLGWRESHYARLEQTRFFVAEHAPAIAVSAIRVIPVERTSISEVTFLLRNTGGSTAQNIRVVFTLFGDKDFLADTGHQSDFFSHFTLGKDYETSVPIVPMERISGRLGWTPETIRIYRPGDDLTPGEQVTGYLQLEFAGEFGDKHQVNQNIAMKRYEPSRSRRK
jgi:hypothetical protein